MSRGPPHCRCAFVQRRHIGLARSDVAQCLHIERKAGCLPHFRCRRRQLSHAFDRPPTPTITNVWSDPACNNTLCRFNRCATNLQPRELFADEEGRAYYSSDIVQQLVLTFTSFVSHSTSDSTT